MAVNYDDKRFTEVENDKKAAWDEAEKPYNDAISNADSYYDKQIQASKDYAETQKKNQQAQTDFAIEQINQQKDQAKKDYIKEQSGAYVDWQKQSNQYGANAEKQAASGMTNTGFSESSQVSMYNTYQNRVTSARESYTRAVLNYDNAIKDARLQNNALLAEIAYNALQQQLELSLQGFQYKNSLIMEKAKVKREIDSEYYGRWKDVLSQINTENAQAEQKRQFDANMAFQREQFEWQKAQANKASSGGGRITKGSSGSSAKKNDKQSRKEDGISIKQNKSKKETQDLSVDMGSVLALGYGPISEKELNRLVADGKVTEYEDGGKLKYKHANALLENQAKVANITYFPKFR